MQSMLKVLNSPGNNLTLLLDISTAKDALIYSDFVTKMERGT